jgi:hypothetical protein
MKHLQRFPKYLLAALAIAAFSVATVGDVAAGERNVTRSWSGPAGSGNASKSVTRGNGAWNRSVTRTGPNGNTLQHDSQRSYDPSTGTGSYNSSTTLPSGATTSRSRTVTRTESGVTVDRQGSGPAGNSRSVTRSFGQ